MIVSFRDSGTEAIFDGTIANKKARRSLPMNLWKIAQRKFTVMAGTLDLDDLKVPPNNHLEALEDDREGQHSIRINDQYRICFVWTEQGPTEVEVVDYHKG